MDYIKINKKIEELSKTNLYNNEQLDAIKYACCLPNFDEALIIDSTIPSSYMLTYVKLATHNKINVKKYIEEKWHLKGFSSDQLYYLIFFDNQGYSIENITPDMSIEQIKNFFNLEQNKKRLREIREKMDISTKPILDKLKDLNVDIVIIEFLLNKMKLGYDISPFLKEDLNKFSWEQIKYLFSIYSIGRNIESIFDSNLSVSQMIEIQVKSQESQDFIKEIIESHENRKR